MTNVDTRRPAVVREELQRRLADLLAPRGFVAGAHAAKLKRKVGGRTDVISFASSHHNVPGSVTCWVALVVEDAAVRKRVKGWSAGGMLTGESFAAELPTNVAVPADADRLVAEVVDWLPFFDLLGEPGRVRDEVQRRYVPGLIAPIRIVPYLTAHLGRGAALGYATALLAARPELWPGFLRTAGAPAPRGGIDALHDHGTQLAAGLGDEASDLAPPRDVARARQLTAAHQRDFLGLQLRAWGEPEAAAALSRLSDDAIDAVRRAQDRLGIPITTSEPAARLVLAATGIDRSPRRAAPVPTLFQYHARHATFASS